MKFKNLENVLKTIIDLREKEKKNEMLKKKLEQKAIKKIKKMIFNKDENVKILLFKYEIIENEIIYDIILKLLFEIDNKIFKAIVNVNDIATEVRLFNLQDDFYLSFSQYDNELSEYFKKICQEICEKYKLNYLLLDKKKLKELKEKNEKNECENEILSSLI